MAIALRTYQTWIKKSAEQLDKDVPGWHTKIDISNLKMGDEDFCICGQLGINTLPNPDWLIERNKLPFFRSAFDHLAYSGLRGFHLPNEFKIVNYNYNESLMIQNRLRVYQINKRRSKV